MSSKFPWMFLSPLCSTPNLPLPWGICFPCSCLWWWLFYLPGPGGVKCVFLAPLLNLFLSLIPNPSLLPSLPGSRFEIRVIRLYNLLLSLQDPLAHLPLFLLTFKLLPTPLPHPALFPGPSPIKVLSPIAPWQLPFSRSPITAAVLNPVVSHSPHLVSLVLNIWHRLTATFLQHFYHLTSRTLYIPGFPSNSLDPPSYCLLLILSQLPHSKCSGHLGHFFSSSLAVWMISSNIFTLSDVYMPKTHTFISIVQT